MIELNKFCNALFKNTIFHKILSFSIVEFACILSSKSYYTTCFDTWTNKEHQIINNEKYKHKKIEDKENKLGEI